MPDQYEKFTERTRKVFSLAQEEAQRLDHDYIGTEHLLLGIIRDSNSLATVALTNLGVTLSEMQSTVEVSVGRGQDSAPDLPLTPRAKRAIELAMDEARRLNHPFVGVEHLLLGLLREGEGVAARILAGFGVNLDAVRQEIGGIVPLDKTPPKPNRDFKVSQFLASKEHNLKHKEHRGRDKFEKFTERARKVFSLAQEEAQRFNHNYIGTEHLLLGLVREGDGIAACVLANLGVQLPKVRSEVEFIIGRGDGLVVGDPGLTPRAKKVIELAMDEARRLNNHYIGTEHLLLGLIREGEGIAAGVLESLGVSLERVRQSVMQVVSQSSSYQASRAQGSTTEEGTPQTGRAWKMLLALSDSEFERLATLADQQGRTLADLIREAIRRTWLTEEEGTNAPDQPAPPSDS